MAKPGEDDTRTSAAVTTDHGAAGRIEVDRQGNRVWRWAREMLDSTSILLKRLENQDLTLEPTQKVPVVPATTKPAPSARTSKGGAKPGKAEAKPAKRKDPVELSVAREPGERDSVGGFDPYNSRR
jgi:hypothetical protein